jgi:hypothetical protein
MPRLTRILSLFSCATLAIVSVSSGRAQTALFYQPPTQQLSVTQQSDATFVDLNGDNKADMAFTTGSGIQVVLNNGTVEPTVSTGTCTPQASRAYTYFVPVDINKDGKTDLAFACGDGRLGIALGNGDGTLQAPVYSTLPGAFTVFTLADMNGDGTPDLIAWITSGQHSGTLAVALVQGGSFSAIHYYPVTSTVYSIATGDFNGDGKKDVATTGYELTYWLGHGDGTLSAPASVPEADSSLSVAAGDLNGDGFDDLVTTSSANYTMNLYYGSATGTLSDDTDTYPLGEAGGGFVTIADLTGTGRKDVVLTNFEQASAIYLNDGTGHLSLDSSYTDYSGDTPAQVADWNGDGVQDLIEQTGYVFDPSTVPFTIYALLGNGDGTFQGNPATQQQSDRYPLITGPGFAAGDWNGDGLLDAVTISFQPPQLANTGVLQVLTSRGDGTFLSSTGPQVPFGFPVTADLNKDGKPDVAILSLNSNSVQLTACLNNGSGTFSCLPTQSFGVGDYFSSNVATVADLDGDGIPDLIFEENGSTNGSPQVFYYAKGKGDGTFAKEVATNITQQISLSSVAQNLLVADVNGDGHPDLILAGASASNQTSIFFGNGTTTFTAAPSTLSGIPLAVADLNGDGKPDIVTSGGTTVWIYLNGGDGNFAASPQTFTVTPQPLGNVFPAPLLYQPVGVGDVNGDGLPDIIFDLPGTSPGDNSLTVLLNAGSGNFTLAPRSYSSGYSYLPSPQIFLGKLNRKATTSGAKAHLDVAAVNGYNLVGMLNLGNSAPTDGASTETSLTASANPIASGATETLTAKVVPTSGASIPTGTVTFYQGQLSLGTVTLANGIASFSAPTTGIAEGEYPVQAVYNGSTSFQSSQSAVLDLSVTQATALTETYLLCPSVYGYLNIGQTATLIATVTPIAGTGIPTGSVAFFAAAPTGAVLGLGTVPLVNGTATLSATIPAGTPPGFYLITAQYQGSSSYAASTSRGLSQGVSESTATTILSASINGSTAEFSLAISVVDDGFVGGTVTISSGGLSLPPVNVSSATPMFSVSVPQGIPAGTYPVVATYTPYLADEAPSTSPVFYITVP